MSQIQHPKRVADTVPKCREYGYLGNTLVKRNGVTLPYTQEQLDEYIKCSIDPIYFIKTYMMVIHIDHGLVPFNLYDYQEKMIENYVNNRFVINLCSRQVGKSTVAVGYYLWRACFHPEKFIAILANKASVAKELLGRITLALENLPYFLQPGCKTLNKGNIEFSNNTQIMAAATSSSSIRGFSVSDLLLDEFAFVDNAEKFFESTYPVISSGTKSNVIIVSTLNGPSNLFYTMYEKAVQGTNNFFPFRVDWHDMPGRDENWKKETIANIGEEKFRQEFGNECVSASNSLISGTALLRLRAEEPLERQIEHVLVFEKPQPATQYVMTVDVAKGRGVDYSTFTIIKIGEDNKFYQVCTFRDNMISPLHFPAIIVKYAKAYNEALVVIENNDAGQVVCNGVYYDFEYENTFVESMVKAGGIGVTMTKKVKSIGCSNLKDLIELDKLKVCDKVTIQELSNFVIKGASYAAGGNGHDDMAMNLVLFAYIVSSDFFADLTDVDLKKLLFEKHEDDLDDIPLFGIIDDGLGTYGDIQRQDVWAL